MIGMASQSRSTWGRRGVGLNFLEANGRGCNLAPGIGDGTVYEYSIA